MISEIFLKDEKFSDYRIESSTGKISNLNKINIFIGANNSGKSRFLRTLFYDSNFEFLLQEHDLKNIRDQFVRFTEMVRQGLDKAGLEDADGIYKNLKSFEGRMIAFKAGEIESLIRDLRQFTQRFAGTKRFTSTQSKPGIFSSAFVDPVLNAINIEAAELNNKLNSVFPEGFDYKFERIYIPILRGLRPIQRLNTEFDNDTDSYKERTKFDYFQHSPDKEETDKRIFTGLTLYNDVKKLLLGNKDERGSIRAFEEFLSEAFFEGKEVTLIPHNSKDVLLINIDGDEKFVYDVGDGIQALIVMLFPIFLNRDKKFLVFIEEPENSLHPGLQRLFIETLSHQKFDNFQFFFTTHSNHFLDITLDLNRLSIFAFNKINDSVPDKYVFKVNNSSNADIKILDLIGVRNSSVFLSNCTIWVEGITDRLYLKKYLEVYQKHLNAQGQNPNLFLEDLHYSFIEYSGSNITHWSFADEKNIEKIQANRISSKILLVADRDDTPEKPRSQKALRLKELKNKLGLNFIVVDGVEIENTLSGNVLIKTIKNLEGHNSENLKYDESQIDNKKFKEVRLGKFIQDNFHNTKRKYEAESGTLFPKLAFCKAAVENISSFNDLSAEAKKIAKALLDFIRTSNQNT